MRLSGSLVSQAWSGGQYNSDFFVSFYMRPCISVRGFVRLSVPLSVRHSIRPLVRHEFLRYRGIREPIESHSYQTSFILKFSL